MKKQRILTIVLAALCLVAGASGSKEEALKPTTWPFCPPICSK